MEGGGGGVTRQTYHPRSPPVYSRGQTISLIEFNPGSPQEARRLVAPLSMERVGGGGGGGGGGERVCIDRMRRGRALAGMTSERGKGKKISTRSREQTQGCRRQQRQTDSERRKGLGA